MSVGRLAVVLVVFAIAILLGFSAINEATLGAGTETEIVDEEFTPVGGETIELDNSNLADTVYGDSVVVTDSQASEFDEGDDYLWHANNGTITVVESSDLAAESSALIDYDFRQAVDEAQSLRDIFGESYELMSWVLFALIVSVMLAALKIWGSV